MPSYKMSYFDGRGRGEIIRYLFAAAGQEFEDRRLTSEEWQAMKPKSLFGTLPQLEVDGKVLAQSYAIARFVARELGLVGTNSWEEALCDQFIELGEDLVKEVIKARFEQDEAKKQEKIKHLGDTVLPKYMGLFEKALVTNGGSYIVGKGLTVADLVSVAVFDTPLMKDPTAMDKFQKLKDHRARILAVPGLNAYIKNRKQTDI